MRFKKIIKEKSYSEDIQKIIKGNPFMLKVEENNILIYDGEYTNYQENVENNGSKQDIKGNVNWDLLETIKNNSAKIEPKSTGFGEYIHSVVTALNQKKII
jgi:hypothetical protein